MNADAAALERVDRLDRELTRVKAELAKIAARLEQRKTEADKARAAYEQARAALEANRTEERTANRRIEELRSSREAALRVLNTGVGNAEAAQRQLERCDALIDEAETGALELLEQQDTLAAAAAAAERAEATATAALRDDERTAPEQSGALEREHDALTAQRAEAAAALNSELRPRYEGFRERGRYAVSKVSGGSCVACSMAVQAQMLADLRNDKLVTCHGCHRWLLVS